MQKQQLYGIPDTGATNHYINNDTLHICSDIQPAHSPKVAVANGTAIAPNAKAILPLHHQLTPKAKTTFAFDDLKSGALISIGQLCDDDCIAIFQNMM